jgi:hypothetical protein
MVEDGTRLRVESVEAVHLDRPRASGCVPSTHADPLATNTVCDHWPGIGTRHSMVWSVASTFTSSSGVDEPPSLAVNLRTYTSEPLTQTSPSVRLGTAIASTTEFVAGSMRVTNASQQPAALRKAPTVHTPPSPTCRPAPPKSQVRHRFHRDRCQDLPRSGAQSDHVAGAHTPASPAATALGNSATRRVVVTRTCTDAS